MYLEISGSKVTSVPKTILKGELMKTWLAVVLIFAVVYAGCYDRTEFNPVGPPALTDSNILPTVIYTYPANGSQGPYNPPANQISIRFNKIMDVRSVMNALHFNGPGTRAFIDSNTIVLYGGDLFVFSVYDSLVDPFSNYTLHAWKVGTRYSITIDSTAKDINGKALKSSYPFLFTPEPYFRVLKTTPVGGQSGVLTNTSIQVFFNSKIDTTIFSKVTISPQLIGRWRIGSGSADSTVCIFEPNFMAPGTTYSVSVDATAKDRYGNQARSSFATSFSTTTFRISGTSPPANSSNVPLHANIVVDFNDAIDTSRARAAFRITPSVAGQLTPSSDRRRITFTPQSDLTPQVVYSATVDTSLRSANGARISTPYSFSFATASFGVSQTTPSSGATNVSRFTTINATFTGRIDTASVRSAFVMTGGGSSLSGSFTFHTDLAGFTFVPDNLPLAANALHVVTLSTALRSRNGLPMNAAHAFSFTTGN